jgi:hypothetical protein
VSDQLLIIVAEVEARNGRYEARLEDGSLLCRNTRQPFFDGARELLRRGIDPQTRIVMRHKKSNTDSLRSTVEAAARLRVKEADNAPPTFDIWKPFEGAGKPPRVTAQALKPSGGS